MVSYDLSEGSRRALELERLLPSDPYGHATEEPSFRYSVLLAVP
jgi:hypothetical protein